MIELWFEGFTLLEDRSSPDDLGGEMAAFADAVAFRGVLSLIPGAEVAVAGQMVRQDATVLLHDFDVTLQVGDRVRRDKTGETYRVTGSSDLMRSPAWSGLNFAQAGVERVVLA